MFYRKENDKTLPLIWALYRQLLVQENPEVKKGFKFPISQTARYDLSPSAHIVAMGRTTYDATQGLYLAGFGVNYLLFVGPHIYSGFLDLNK